MNKDSWPRIFMHIKQWIKINKGFYSTKGVYILALILFVSGKKNRQATPEHESQQRFQFVRIHIKNTQAHNKVYIVRECATPVTSVSLYCGFIYTHIKWETATNNRNVSYLIVPVGEGTGEAKLESDCGMFIRSGGRTFVLGGLGTRFGVLSLTNDVKRTFTFVEGNRSTQLKKAHWTHFKSATLKQKIKLCH